MSHFNSCPDNLSTVIFLFMVIIAFHFPYILDIDQELIFLCISKLYFIFWNFFLQKYLLCNCCIILLSLMGFQKNLQIWIYILLVGYSLSHLLDH